MHENVPYVKILRHHYSKGVEPSTIKSHFWNVACVRVWRGFEGGGDILCDTIKAVSSGLLSLPSLFERVREKDEITEKKNRQIWRDATDVL